MIDAFLPSNLLSHVFLGGNDAKKTAARASPRRNPLRPVQGNVIQTSANRTNTVVAKPAAASPRRGNLISGLQVDNDHARTLFREHLDVTSLSEDVFGMVLRSIDMKTALRCRVVCKAWSKMVREAGLQPIEAGLRGELLERGLQQHRLLYTAKMQELQTYTPTYCFQLANHMKLQDTITVDMRRTLVNWMTEVHFKFRFREPCLHMAVQLLDRYLSTAKVHRRRYQTVGVTAFMLGCKYEERISPQVGDLVYITDYSSTREDIVEMEKTMLRELDFELVLPKIWDFLPRVAAAAGLSINQPQRCEHCLDLALVLYFVDLSALLLEYSGQQPSLRVGVAVACALRVLDKPPKTERIAYYAGADVEVLDKLAEQLIQAGRLGGYSALDLKYSSQRFGGVAPNGERGIAARLRRFFDALPPAPAPAPVPAQALAHAVPRAFAPPAGQAATSTWGQVASTNTWGQAASSWAPVPPPALGTAQAPPVAAQPLRSASSAAGSNTSSEKNPSSQSMRCIYV